MSEYYNLADVRFDIKGCIRRQGSQKAAAKFMKISAQYLADVLAGRRSPGKKILDALDYRECVLYERKNGKPQPPASENREP